MTWRRSRSLAVSAALAGIVLCSLVRAQVTWPEDSAAVREILDSNGLFDTPVRSVARCVVPGPIGPTGPAECIDPLRITQLYFINMGIHTIPAAIGRIGALQFLRADVNQIGSIPPEIGNLKMLREVILTGNRLQTLPQELLDCTSLARLDVSYNELTSIPASLVQHPVLQLLVGANRLCGLDSTVEEWLTQAQTDWQLYQDCPHLDELICSSEFPFDTVAAPPAGDSLHRFEWDILISRYGDRRIEYCEYRQLICPEFGFYGQFGNLLTTEGTSPYLTQGRGWCGTDSVVYELMAVPPDIFVVPIRTCTLYMRVLAIDTPAVLTLRFDTSAQNLGVSRQPRPPARSSLAPVRTEAIAAFAFTGRRLPRAALLCAPGVYIVSEDGRRRLRAVVGR
jgi:hypothetical protein